MTRFDGRSRRDTIAVPLSQTENSHELPVGNAFGVVILTWASSSRVAGASTTCCVI